MTGDYLQFVTNTTRTDGVPTPYWLSVDSLITSAIFRVDTCADAHVFLMDAVGDMAGKHIEFHLGANNGANCYIKDSGGSVSDSYQHCTDHLHHCHLLNQLLFFIVDL